MRRLTILAATALVLAGCSMLSYGPPLRVLAEPAYVIWRAAEVFQAYDIPVVEQDGYAGYYGRLRSGPFEVRRTWGGDPIEARVTCGEDERGEPRVREAMVSLEIELDAREETRGRLTVTRESRIRLRAKGRGYHLDRPQSEEFRCTLRPAFASALLRDVCAAASFSGGCDWGPDVTIYSSSPRSTVIARPPMITRSPATSTRTSPPRAEAWKPTISRSPSRSDQ